jgi:hypothetical protein
LFGNENAISNRHLGLRAAHSNSWVSAASKRSREERIEPESPAGAAPGTQFKSRISTTNRTNLTNQYNRGESSGPPKTFNNKAQGREPYECTLGNGWPHQWTLKEFHHFALGSIMPINEPTRTRIHFSEKKSDVTPINSTINAIGDILLTTCPSSLNSSWWRSDDGHLQIQDVGHRCGKKVKSFSAISPLFHKRHPKIVMRQKLGNARFGLPVGENFNEPNSVVHDADLGDRHI